MTSITDTTSRCWALTVSAVSLTVLVLSITAGTAVDADCSVFEGDLEACSDAAGCRPSEHCATTNGKCTGTDKDLCEAEDGCAWDVNGHCHLRSCTAISDATKCDSQDSCEWHMHCSSADDGGQSPGSSICEKYVCKDVISLCTGGCNVTFQCVLAKARRGECDNGADSCIKECRSTATMTAEEEKQFAAVVECETGCYDTNECRQLTAGQCEQDDKCMIEQACQPTADRDRCAPLAQDECRATDVCLWSSVNKRCYIGVHDCHQFTMSDACMSAGCAWSDVCGSNSNDDGGYCGVFEGDLEACSDAAGCRPSEHCATTNGKCTGTDKDLCEAEDGCAWDVNGHCHLRSCTAISDATKCDSQDSCEWHMHCSSADDGGQSPGSSICEKYVCKDVISLCTGGCNVTFQCVLAKARRGECDNGADSCIKECRSTATMTAEEEKQFAAVVECETGCYDTNECRQLTAGQCEQDDKCMIEQACQPTADRDRCAPLAQDECRATDVCLWSSVNKRCYIGVHDCHQFTMSDACMSAGCMSAGCAWSDVCGSNSNDDGGYCGVFEGDLEACSDAAGCRPSEHCATTNGKCYGTHKELNDACKQALDCVYNAHANGNGQCDSTCYASCSSYVAGYTFAQSALVSAASCLLDCHDECSPAEQPFIFEKQQCVESTDTVTVNVGSQWEATDRVLRAYCHFYDTDGVCGLSGCMTLGWVAPSSRDGFVSVTCELPDVWDILADGAEVKLRVTLYPSIAQNLVSPVAFGDPSTVNVSVSIDPTYGEDARATCAFWIRNADGRLSCTWHGCYAAATVDAAGDTIMCTLPPSVPEDVSIFVTVQVWHKDNADKQRNQCFSHEGQSSYLWSDYDYGKFTAKCPVPQCTDEYVPRVYGIDPECDLAQDATTIDVSVAIDPTYGDDARATCAFWLPDATGRLSCTWHGCYAAASVNAAGTVITCTLPDGLPPNEEVHVTVQVWHKDNTANKQRNECFSHEGQSSYSWGGFDFGVFSVNCPGPECTDAYVPRVYGIEPACGLEEGAQTVNVSVAIDPTYGADARATCAFWLPDTNNRVSCTWHGCYAAATVNAAGDTIMCTLPEGLPLNEPVRVTVQVWHKDNANKQDNQCFSHEGQSSYHWSEYDSGVFLVNCPAPVCAHDTVPRVYRVNPGCGLDADASTVEVGVWIDPTYGDDARATCAFWRPTSDGSSWQCTWHGCYAPATVDVDRNVITCEVPNGMPASGPVRITVQVWHANNEDKQDNQCFSHEGQSPSKWKAYDYAVLEIRCPAPECRPQYVPRVFEVEPACGLAEDAETVDVSVAIDPSLR
ncbi:hypothetical protein PTSG_06042 [Salpingoeca rosetta]|uniref:Uncharacterized protein n=1 Tax=Salpingoeca rosetta (strain ATCC 50818 / BSB-021) TaxID=946362 RepID=F2UDI2_SALR5|nr:uncharacterized protein PTSG_06042 [Salpingoeca rosetta]EGD74677.1 hypothetical protein PTSG_06042 [Salpingoeca rosetta]|eukprot:XP_004992934.1 hypothetical protein PTSG_06042 [Salpingoeca rosetta]